MKINRRKMIGMSIATLAYAETAFAEELFREESRTFEYIKEQAQSVDYTVEEIYDPDNKGAPKNILIGTVHNRDNLDRILNILSNSLRPGDILATEGLDDEFDKHLQEAKERYQLEDEYMQKIATEYKSRHIRKNPQFISLEQMATDKETQLVGADNTVLAILQTHINMTMNFTADPNQRAQLYKTYIDMSRQRTQNMANVLVSLSGNANNQQNYLVTGAIHLGLYPREEPILTHRMKSERLSYIMLRPKELTIPPQD